ncbi:MAG TPA: hypothetical protein VE685_03360 [Thermoanaerobaculia bacterium]|nr:hypothetical protein [Thermoanaerobaculia bacterium]
MRRIAISSILLFLLLATVSAARAQSAAQRWELGPRFRLLTAGGRPANDMFGPGAYGRYRLNERWLVGFAVDSITGDYERPYEIAGLSSPEEIDSTVDALVLSGWVEREYGRTNGKLRWFWSAGFGFSSPDTDDITGPVSGGGTFDITTDAGSEILVSVGGGLRRGLGRRWSFEVGVQVDQHFTEWTVTDRVSGRTGTLDNYTTRGLLGGLTYRF